MEEVAIIADSKSKGFEFVKGVYSYLKGKEGKEFSVCLINIEETNFKDSEFKLKIAENIRGKYCFLIHDSNKEASRWLTELVFILEATSFSSPKEVNVVLPYMRFSRQDRKDESRVGVSAKAVADIVSLYADRGMTVDLHAPQIQEYFSIPFDNLPSVMSMINYLQKHHKDILNNLVVVAADLGGGKRVEMIVKRLAERGIKAGIALGHKTREKDDEVAKTIIIGNVEGKNCLIVDDIIDTGNTMVSAAKKLKESGAAKVFAYGTHCLFADGIEKFKVFDKILAADTFKVPQADNIEVVSLAHLFGEAIYRTAVGKSLSVLFNDDKSSQGSLENYDI
jgi:ribose-phosphate pyrophosphokinase